jgi:pimeloyl-ACP methyl ester carboxylesterase
MTNDSRERRAEAPASGARRSDARGFTEEAFFFGPSEAPLFAVLHRPVRATKLPPIIHVHSYGIEQVAAYRIEVEFARAAAAAGFPVLRFHMTGAGDSFGDFAEMTIAGMVADVGRALELTVQRGLSSDSKPVLLGVRLGCDVAVRAAEALGRVRGLILWEPAQDPRAYFDSILRSRLISALAQGKKTGDTVASLVEQLHAEGSVDVLGYPVHRRIYDEASPLAIRSAPVATDALVVSIGKRQKPPARCVAVERMLADAGARCEIRELREEVAWQFNSNPSFVSPALTELTLAWCLARFGGAEHDGARSAIASTSEPRS